MTEVHSHQVTSWKKEASWVRPGLYHLARGHSAEDKTVSLWRTQCEDREVASGGTVSLLR